ncbi:pro-resilin-like [Portunus trituberculatus]|uniref:pro-resilin-like n=1 Tax=Portunus trituberculatus TaxID=210409 RepID=UPI001E1CFE52|nr:pro-resilin-like [Portunus trituberculatus]
MNAKLVALLALAAAASAARPNYNFQYAVQDSNSRNNYGHEESRQLENTNGRYFAQLPDGRLQEVNYRVDGDSGFLAEVTYDGEARFPDSDESFESRGRRVFSAPSSSRSSSSSGRFGSSSGRSGFGSSSSSFGSSSGRSGSSSSFGSSNRFNSFEDRFNSPEDRFDSRFDSREDRFPFASRESREFPAAPRNPFLRAASRGYRYD